MADRVDSEEFGRLTDPYRRELLAHCYRMLGSIDDAEDLVQETYLRAWRGYSGFEGRSSLRTWLYRIATSACLTALENRERRPLPSGLGLPDGDAEADPRLATTEVSWLQPFPDRWLEPGRPGDPATAVVARSTIRLAFVAALQHLPARQRAVLILRDVLAWKAKEVAELFGTTTWAVKSTLQRARARLADVAPAEEEMSEPAGPEQRALLDRYVAAFENADIASLLETLRADVEFEMPPFLTWFAGREAVVRFLRSRVLRAAGDMRLLPVEANGQFAMAMYHRGADGVHRAHAIQVLDVAAGGIARIVTFLEPGLFPSFGLPPIHPADTDSFPNVTRSACL